MQITGTAFQAPVDGVPAAADIGPARVFLFDANSGTNIADPTIPWSVGDPVRRLGTGNPAVFAASNSAPAFGTDAANPTDLGVETGLPGFVDNPAIPNYTATGTTLTGETRLDGELAQLDTNLDGIVRVRIRVTNPDGQIHETNSFDPAGQFIRDLDYRLTHATPVDRDVSAGATNNNVSVAFDPTSVTDPVGVFPFAVAGAANDFAPPQAQEGGIGVGAFGANLFMISENDTTAGGIFQGTTLRTSLSRDGGLTWTNHLIGGAGGVGVDQVDGQLATSVRTSPWASYDRFGNLWMSYLVRDAAAVLPDRILLIRSSDQGDTLTFINVVVDSAAAFGAGSGSLATPALAVGFASDAIFGPFGDGQGAYVAFARQDIDPNEIHVVGRYTNQHGNSFGPSAITRVDDPSFAGTILLLPRPAVGPDGALYVTWLNTNPAFFGFQFSLQIDSDQDGLFDPTHAFDADRAVDAVIPFSFGFRPVSVDFGPQLPTPAITVVRNGAHLGRVVVAYEEFSNAGFGGFQALNLVHTYSDNFGLTWSTPQLVAKPAPNALPSDQFLPALTSDDVTGRVYVTWYDTRVSAPANDQAERLSAASDDGASFGRPLVLSAGPSSTPGGDAEFSDYGIHSGLAAFGGCVIAGWADNAAFLGALPHRLDPVVKLYQQSALANPTGP
jgi:hypothetical protein